MRVKVAVNKVVSSEGKVSTYSAQTQYVEGENLRFFNVNGNLMILQQFDDGRSNQYFCNITWANASGATAGALGGTVGEQLILV